MKLVGFCTLLLLTNGQAAPVTNPDIQNLMRRYEQVEGQLDRSIHYVRKTESGSATKIEQAWFNGAGDLIKVAVERTDPSGGRELTEYFENNFENNEEPMFMLIRKETQLPDGGTQVDESRRYFGSKDHTNAVLILELRKSARFKAGESTDTIHDSNVGGRLVEETENNCSGVSYNTHEANKETGPPLVSAPAL